jgi:hypothetical protein
MENKQTEINLCCPPFDPTPWEEKTHVWEDRLFVKHRIPTFFHIPWPPMIGRMMTRMWTKAQEANAAPDLKDFLVLAYDPTPFRCEYYMSVLKEVPGMENVKLSGTFISKVFDGPYSSAPKWIKDMESLVAAQGKSVLKHYLYYTTCPKCAKLHGHNYVVAFAQIA